MVGNLALLHRYTLVRTHVKIGDHHQAAKLLIQVAANISRFPARKHIRKRIKSENSTYFINSCYDALFFAAQIPFPF